MKISKMIIQTKFSQSGGSVLCLSVGILSAIALGIGSCGSNPSSDNAESPQTDASESNELQIVTTFLPITEFTKAVAGDRAEVTQLLPTTVGPHEYQAKPEDAQILANADVLVENGLGIEEFLNDLVANAGNRELKIIDSSEGIKTISNEEVEGEEHAQGEAEAGHHHDGEYNPHIWLDPKRVIEQVENIRDGLSAADPDGEQEYTANAAAYIDKLRQLDSEFTQKLQPFAGETFVTYHDFAPYFAQSYRLKAEYLVDIPEENASPQDVQRVINAAKGSDLKTLLTEPQAAGNPFSALAKDLKVQVSNFDPLETAGTQGVQPDYYFTVMRQNLSNLEAALGRQTTQTFVPDRFRSTLAVTPQPVSLPF